MVKAINILAKIIGACFLIALVLWLISYAVGISIYVKEAVNIPKLSSLEQQKEYVAQKEKEIFRDIDIFKLLFAGGGWRYRAVLTLNQKIFEYFPKEANNDVDALFHLADCYAWLGSKVYSLKAISLYRESIDIFVRKHLNEKAPLNAEPVLFETRKYEFLISRHNQIAQIYKHLNLYDNVLDEYKKVIGAYYDNIKKFSIATQYHLIGGIYEKIGYVYLQHYKNYNEAIRYFKEAMNLFPEPLAMSINKTNIGDCYLAMGDEEKAKETYQSVIKEYKWKKFVDISAAEYALKNLKRHKKFLTKYAPLLF